MKIKCWMAVFICSLLCVFSVWAQSVRDIAVNPKAETRLRLVSQSDNGLEFNNRLGGVDKAFKRSVPSAFYTATSVSGVPLDFTSLEVEGYAFTNKVGYPELPVRVEMIEIPEGATLRVVYGRTSSKDIDLAKAGYPMPVCPVQPPLSKSSRQTPDFVYNAEAYRLDDFVSDGNSKDLVDVEILGEMRGVRMAKVVVKPIQYNAFTHTLRVYTTLDFEIVFDHADWQKTVEKRKKYASPVFGLLRHEVANPSKSEEYNAPIRYVIVADPMFKDSLQKFVNWKARFGFDVVQAYTDQPEVGATAQSIHDYLKGLYDNATEADPAPSYVLFVGDLEQVPTKTYGEADYWGDGEHYSDLYLCEYTGDHFPEVQYGRMSAKSVEELMPQIDKTIHMESLTPDRAAFLDTCVAIAGYDKTHYASHLNPTINYLCTYYMKDTLQRHAYGYLAPDSRQQSQNILQNFNNGISMILYTAHGNYDSWSEPYISVSDVNKLSNKGKYPLAIGNCCLTGKFDMASCFGETLLRKQDAGAVVYIGASDLTYFDHDVYWAIGYTRRLGAGVVQTYEDTELGVFDAWCHTHGEEYSDWALSAYEIVYTGNMAVQRANQDLEDYYWEVYHVFGDPSYMPYMYAASYPRATYSGSLILGESAFPVQTEPYARVTVSRNGVIYGFAMADARGMANVVLHDMIEPGEYDLVVAAQNFLPLQEKVEVLAPAGQYVIVSSCELLDTQDEPVEGSLLYGERYNARLTLRNVGNESVSSVDVRIEPLDEYLDVENAVYTLTEEFESGEERFLSHLFGLKVNPNIPNNYLLSFRVRLVFDGKSDSAVTKIFRTRASASELKVVSFVIDDSEGINPNGVIDNGETVKASVRVQNLSHIAASSIKVRVTSDADFLDMPDEDIDLGDLEAGQSGEFTFSYSAKNAGVYYTLYCLEFDFSSRGRLQKDSIRSYIEPVTETFESGDFSFVDWDKDSDWRIDDTTFHNGRFSAVSGMVADGETSTLKIEVDVTIDDVVGFYYLTSSECLNNVLGDFLQFYIDGERQGRWAGEASEWQYVEFPVSAGRHTLEWRYVKDASDSKGKDRVWIDDVRLPIGSLAPFYVANERQVLGTESILWARAGRGRLEVEYNTQQARIGNLYVVNANGQRVRQLAKGLHLQGKGTESFSVDGWACGMYILVFEEANGKRQTAKFIVVD